MELLTVKGFLACGTRAVLALAGSRLQPFTELATAWQKGPLNTEGRLRVPLVPPGALLGGADLFPVHC